MILKQFYDTIRGEHPITMANVPGFDALILRMERDKIQVNLAAYMLATTALETAYTMQPIQEYGGDKYFNSRYGPHTKVGKRLGNTRAGDGARYCGRGFVQITGRSNYVRVGKNIGVDLVGDPDLALGFNVAYEILKQGSLGGWFTGKGLLAYIDDIDESDEEDYAEYLQARRVVNGTDKRHEIAKMAVLFEKALKAGDYLLRIQAAQPKLPPILSPPGRAEPPVTPVAVEPIPKSAGEKLGFWAGLWAVLFGKG